MKFFRKALLLSLVLMVAVITLASCNQKKKVTLSAEKNEISVVIGESVDLKLRSKRLHRRRHFIKSRH